MREFTRLGSVGIYYVELFFLLLLLLMWVSGQLAYTSTNLTNSEINNHISFSYLKIYITQTNDL